MTRKTRARSTFSDLRRILRDGFAFDRDAPRQLAVGAHEEQIRDHANWLLDELAKCVNRLGRREGKPRGTNWWYNRALAVAAGLVGYFAAATYVFGGAYLRQYFAWLLPGTNIDLTYSAVCTGLLSHPAGLVVTAFPAALVAVRAFSPDYPVHRRRAGDVVRNAGAARAFARLLEGPTRDAEDHVLADSLEEGYQQALWAMPDGFWRFATWLAGLPGPPALVTGCFLLLTSITTLAGVRVLGGFGLDVVQSLPWFTALGGPVQYALVAFLFNMSVFFLTGLLASGVYVTLILIESHYRPSRAKLFRRRFALLCVVAVLMYLAMWDLGARTGKIDAAAYEVRFPRVQAIAITDGEIAPMALSVPEPKMTNGLQYISGFLVSVPGSRDTFLLVKRSRKTDLKSVVPYGVVTLPIDTLKGIRRGFTLANTSFWQWR